MPTYRTTLQADGTIELPPELCAKLGVKPGLEVEFFLAPSGDVFFHGIAAKADNWSSLVPIEKRSPPLSIREMDESISDYLLEKHERIKAEPTACAEPKHKSAAE